jgi:hypothetical protein
MTSVTVFGPRAGHESEIERNAAPRGRTLCRRKRPRFSSNLNLLAAGGRLDDDLHEPRFSVARPDAQEAGLFSSLASQWH